MATRGIPDIDQLKNENEYAITEIRTRGHNFPSNVLLGRSWSTVRVITISGNLFTSPIWMSQWDVEETHSSLYSSPSDFVPQLYPMKLCKIIEDKQLHTTSKQLMAVAMTRQKNSDEKSGGGACGDRGITSLQLRFSGIQHFFNSQKKSFKRL